MAGRIHARDRQLRVARGTHVQHSRRKIEVVHAVAGVDR
jgi:hypothetical protein